MPSTTICIKLRSDEVDMLDHVCSPRCDAGGVGKLNRSEMIRMLIMREYKRRTTGKSVVNGKEFSSDFRRGRPKKETSNAEPIN